MQEYLNTKQFSIVTIQTILCTKTVKYFFVPRQSSPESWALLLQNLQRVSTVCGCCPALGFSGGVFVQGLGWAVIKFLCKLHLGHWAPGIGKYSISQSLGFRCLRKHQGQLSSQLRPRHGVLSWESVTAILSRCHWSLERLWERLHRGFWKYSRDFCGP